MSNLQPVKFEDVYKSYNGKSGCMCGCNGAYTLPSHTPIEDANTKLGYNGYDQDDVSDRRVKIALRKINDAIVNPCDELESGDDWIALDDGRRTTVIYLKPKS